MNIFQQITAKRPQSSKFNLTHSRKFSFAPGILYPILCQETLPGDKWSYDTSALVRFQPLISPVMHLVDVCSYSFRVPMRLCMERAKFEVFITGGAKGDGKDAQGNTVMIPYCEFWGGDVSDPGKFRMMDLGPGTLGDYLGIGLGEMDPLDPGLTQINMIPFIAFWRVWNEYFRDQNLHPDYVDLYPDIFSATGNITAAIYAAYTNPTVENRLQFFNLPQVCWEKDYFTSALPFAQRGEPVETPLQGTATVSYKTPALVDKTATPNAGALRAGTAQDAPLTFTQDVSGTNTPVGLDNIDSVELISGGFTINALRLAARLQEWLEKMARGGARYIEQIKSQFGVTSSDARLQRPEYLAGGKLPVSISEVLQTGENGTTPLAEMAGHAIAAGKVTGWSSFMEEHCILISVIFLRPKTAYQNGTPRLFTKRFDKLDWAWPSFAHLGEQEVLNGEVYMTNNQAWLGTFGYQQRYAEYKYIPSTVHGEFKTTLDFWHWGRKFDELPTLSPEFVACDPDPRIFNVIQDGDPLYCIVNNKIDCVRPLPYQGDPHL